MSTENKSVLVVNEKIKSGNSLIKLGAKLGLEAGKILPQETYGDNVTDGDGSEHCYLTNIAHIVRKEKPSKLAKLRNNLKSIPELKIEDFTVSNYAENEIIYDGTWIYGQKEIVDAYTSKLSIYNSMIAQNVLDNNLVQTNEKFSHVIVMNEEIQSGGIIINTGFVLGVSVSKESDQEISANDITIKKEKPAKLAELRNTLKSIQGLKVFDYTEDASTSNYAEYTKLLNSHKGDEIVYRGIWVYGPTDIVDAHTSKLSVYNLMLV